MVNFSNFFKIILSIISNNKSNIQMKVLKTSMLSFAPFLKLHHIVLLSNSNEVYTVDFSPINQSRARTLLKLLIAVNVPAETRIRHIEDVSFFEDEQIEEKWSNMNNIDFIESQKLSDKTYKEINDPEMKNIIDKIKEWNNSMNLYTHNCQHFSSFVSGIGGNII
jgi:hypothetical protein